MRRLPSALLLACLACGADDAKPKGTGDDKTTSPIPQQKPDSAGLAATAGLFVDRILELETSKDVTCWTSFRQLDNFIAAKSYSDFATLTKIEAAKALAHAVWAAASEKTAGDQVTPADIEAVFSVEADLPAAKKAELEKFADDLGMQQFRDYRTTSEHWRVLLSVAQDELGRANPTVKPLTAEAADRLALATTKLGLSLLTESGAIATQARTPYIEAEHVKKAYENLLRRYDVPEVTIDATQAPQADAFEPRAMLTGGLIEAKIKALRHYNASSGDLHQEINKLSKTPIDPEATQRMVAELASMARFFASGKEMMRRDNYLADGNFAPAQLANKPYIEAAYVEDQTQNIWPYLMLPNGDIKMRFEPRPGHISKRDLAAQDVTLVDHHMNAVRDTALHWVILHKVWKDQPYAMDPFAAEYLSELISIVATFYLRRAGTMARQQNSEVVTGEIMARVRDPGFAMVPPTEQQAVQWGEAQQAAKDKALANYGGPLFADVTAKWGLPTKTEVTGLTPGEERFDIQSVMGSGIAVGDINGDARPDLFLSGEGLGKLYLNEGGKRFTDVTSTWAVPEGLVDSRGALFWDYDGDGDLDLLILRSRNKSHLLQNEGTSFKDVGLETKRGAHVATAFDYDGDDDLDLYVGYYGSAECNQGDCPGRNLPSMDGRNGTPNQLFRNDGGSFVEIAKDAGVDDAGWTLAASSFDYDRDGDRDLYLANDFGQNPLLRNNGDGTFVDVAADLRAADRGSGMNVSFADVDGNGEFDVFVSNIDMFSKNIKVVFPKDESVVKLSDQILRSFQYLSGNKLYFNVKSDDGKRRFEAREATWFEPGDRGWGWAGVFFDYDLDGDEDFYLANGWIPGSPASDQKNQMFIRDGEVFYRAAASSPEAFAGNSRSVVAADFDSDGDLDLVVNNYAQPPRLLENRQRVGKMWVKVRLKGTGANTRAVGAELVLKTSGQTQRRWVTCGNGYLGQDDELVHFGLGTAKTADLEVVWPDGSRASATGLAAGQVHELSP